MTKTLSYYKMVYKNKSRGKSKSFKEGLIMGLLATTNNKKIREWLQSQET